ncbi:hypothetical protein L7F22_004691 [Adiantum nelumboides]|nr:hypothetical protein [Adiantum nelumboides]
MQNAANECQIQELMEQVQEKNLQSEQLCQMEASRNSLAEKFHGQQSQLRSTENELETVKLELAGKNVELENEKLAKPTMIQTLNANAVKLKNQRGRLSGFATALDGHKMAVGNESLANRLHWVEAVGYASLWGAILTDVGTCLLVIFNSMLLLERKKDESGCLGLFAFRRKCRSKVCQKDVLLSSEKYVDLEAEPWHPKKMEDNRVFAHGTKQENKYYLSYCATKSSCDVRGANNGMRQRVNNKDAGEKNCQCIAIDEGLLVGSDVADDGSKVRDSLLGGSSEGDVESVRYQELASYVPAHGTVRSQDFSSKEGRHVEVESAPIYHLDKHADERDMILQYYSEKWGHSKESGQMDVTGRSNLDLGPLAHLGVWALKFASVQSYKHFIAKFQNCSFNNTYLLEATEENKIKVLGKDFAGWAKTEEANDSIWEDAKDGSETPFFSKKDFKGVLSEMASGENLANFDSFPSSKEGPFKFNMIGNFGRQKLCIDADQDYNLISGKGGRVSPVHLGIRLHVFGSRGSSSTCNRLFTTIKRK